MTLTEIGTDVGKGISAIKGWVEDVEKHIPTILETASKYENSPIVKALEGIVLPPHIEESVAKLIADLAEEYAHLTTSDTTPADTSTTAPATS